jgi:hypothetical protein
VVAAGASKPRDLNPIMAAGGWRRKPGGTRPRGCPRQAAAGAGPAGLRVAKYTTMAMTNSTQLEAAM